MLNLFRKTSLFYALSILLLIAAFLLLANSFLTSPTINFQRDYHQISRSYILNQKDIPVYRYKIIRSYPHNTNYFTQGLVYHSGFLYEGTGLYGDSYSVKENLQTGKIVKIKALGKNYFGEGLTTFGNRLYRVTLKSNIGFVYNKTNFKLIKTFRYPTQGWGLTHDKHSLIMSDGSSVVHFLNPQTLKETRDLYVSDGKFNVGYLNGLQYANGYIYANIWQTDFIARISEKTGRITAWIDLEGLNPNPKLLKYSYVLNGIAYDNKTGHLFVTGKCWPKLYEIALT